MHPSRLYCPRQFSFSAPPSGPLPQLKLDCNNGNHLTRDKYRLPDMLILDIPVAGPYASFT